MAGYSRPRASKTSNFPASSRSSTRGPEWPRRKTARCSVRRRLRLLRRRQRAPNIHQNTPLCARRRERQTYDTQINGKAYPSLRELAVAHEMQGSGDRLEPLPDPPVPRPAGGPAVRLPPGGQRHRQPPEDRASSAVPARAGQRQADDGEVPCLLLNVMYPNAGSSEEDVCNSPAQGLSVPDFDIMQNFVQTQHNLWLAAGGAKSGQPDPNTVPVCQLNQIRSTRPGLRVMLPAPRRAARPRRCRRAGAKSKAASSARSRCSSPPASRPGLGRHAPVPGANELGGRRRDLNDVVTRLTRFPERKPGRGVPSAAGDPASSRRATMHAFRIGKLFGIEIRVDWSWLFIFVLLTWNLSPSFSHGTRMAAARAFAVAARRVLCSSSRCVLAHEFAHSSSPDASAFASAASRCSSSGACRTSSTSRRRRGPSSPIAVVGPITSILLGIGFLGAVSSRRPFPLRTRNRRDRICSARSDRDARWPGSVPSIWSSASST